MFNFNLIYVFRTFAVKHEEYSLIFNDNTMITVCLTCGERY